jgi:hypothetical protein
MVGTIIDAVVCSVEVNRLLLLLLRKSFYEGVLKHLIFQDGQRMSFVVVVIKDLTSSDVHLAWRGKRPVS